MLSVCLNGPINLIRVIAVLNVPSQFLKDLRAVRSGLSQFAIPAGILCQDLKI